MPSRPPKMFDELGDFRVRQYKESGPENKLVWQAQIYSRFFLFGRRWQDIGFARNSYEEATNDIKFLTVEVETPRPYSV